MKQTYIWQGGSSFVTCAGSICQNLMRFSKNQAYVSKKDPVWSACLLLSWVQRSAGASISSHDGFSWFSCLETVSSAQMDVSEAILLCWRTMWLAMTHRAPLASLKKLSSESNNGGREDCSPLGSRLCVANVVFFCYVLRIHLSELIHVLTWTYLGWQGMILCDRHVYYYHECRDLLEEKFRIIIDFHVFCVYT